MQRIILAVFMVATVIAGFSLPPAQAAETPSPPSISVDADGKVMATPDLARLTLEVETQAATAAAAGQENAKQANAVLAAVKPVLGPEDKLRTLGYRLLPVHAYKDKSSPPEIKGYRAVNQIEVKVLDVARLGTVIDTAMKNGATRVNGPLLEPFPPRRTAAPGGGECPGTSPAPGRSPGPGGRAQNQGRGQDLHRDPHHWSPGGGGGAPDGQGGQPHPHRSG